MASQTHSAAERLVSTLADDPDMSDLVAIFLSELPRNLELVEAAVARRDRDELRRQAHRMRGSYAGYGFPTLSFFAGDLEREILEGSVWTRVAVRAGMLVYNCRRAIIATPQSSPVGV